MDLKRIVRIAMMAALIFAGTYTFKNTDRHHRRLYASG